MHFAHVLTHAFAQAMIVASPVFQGSEMSEVDSSASAKLPPQEPVLLGSSVFCPGLEPASVFRMLLVDGVIFHCLQGAIAPRKRMMPHCPFYINTVTEMTPLLAIQGFPSSESIFCCEK